MSFFQGRLNNFVTDCRLMKIVVVSLLDGLIIATTAAHNQTNQKFSQKLISLALTPEAKSLGPFCTITTAG